MVTKPIAAIKLCNLPISGVYSVVTKSPIPFPVWRYFSHLRNRFLPFLTSRSWTWVQFSWPDPTRPTSKV